MKKPLFPRIVYFLLLYMGIFVVIVTLQFSQQRGFTRRIGAMAISGHFGEDADPPVATARFSPEEQADPSAPGESMEVSLNPGETAYSLAGELVITFGGIDFRISSARDGYRFLYEDGSQSESLPTGMILAESSATFLYPGGMSLTFAVLGQRAGQRTPELRITASLGEDIQALELPYQPRRSSRIRDSGNGRFYILSGGLSYSFSAAKFDESKRILIIERGSPAIAYKAVPESKAFNPSDYTLALAEDPGQYAAALRRWAEVGYRYWSRYPAALESEKSVLAYLSEGVARNTYQQAIASLPRNFTQGNQRTHYSAAYLGRLDQGFRSFIEAEGRIYARFASLANSGSMEFLAEDRIVAQCFIRGWEALVRYWLESAEQLEAEALSPEYAALLLEAYTDWQAYSPDSAEENPFEPYCEAALATIASGLFRDNTDRIAFFVGSQAGTELNLRLGLALDVYGTLTGQQDWAAVGRSLVITALRLSEPLEEALFGRGSAEFNAGALTGPGAWGEDGSLSPAAQVSLEQLYGYLGMPYYPRAVAITRRGGNALYAWTVATDIQARELSNNELEIDVSFPPGETHYMMIRGIRPFAKLQMYNMDYRTDPQFERYDSSGWTYSSQEQTLILKMKHRDQVEQIRIFY